MPIVRIGPATGKLSDVSKAAADDVETATAALRSAGTNGVLVTPDKLLSTSITNLNLAFSGNPYGGILAGSYYLWVGDSDSGKTYCGLAALAEASIDPKFDGYRLIYNNREAGALMDIATHYGSKLAKRLEQPEHVVKKVKERRASRTVEEWYDHLDALIKAGKPFIEVMDSEASLSSEAEEKKNRINASIRSGTRKPAKGEEGVGGDYGDNKAKIHSRRMRSVVDGLASTGSILFVLTQTRDKIGFGAMPGAKSRAGGWALSFYATVEVWSKVKMRIEKAVNGKNRHLGNLCEMSVRRTRLTGRKLAVTVPIYFKTGIDDTGACCAWLVDEKHWKGTWDRKQPLPTDVEAPEFDYKGPFYGLVKLIQTGTPKERAANEKKLRQLVHRVWLDIEDQCQIDGLVRRYS